jgi:hypothetical protein
MFQMLLQAGTTSVERAELGDIGVVVGEFEVSALLDMSACSGGSATLANPPLLTLKKSAAAITALSSWLLTQGAALARACIAR